MEKKKKFQIQQNRDLCIGCGHCTMVCPENWEMDNIDYKSKPKKEIIDESEYEGNKNAADECPVQCITITPIDTN